MTPGTPTWARLLLLVGATGLAFLLSAVAAFFLGSLASEGSAPLPDREPVTIEETTGANTNEEVEQTGEETITSTDKSRPDAPRQSPRKSPPESSATATATATASP